MKVMLIDPPGFGGNAVGRILGSFGTNKADQAWPPYDLQIMAGYCRKNNHEYRVLDANNLGLSYQKVQTEIGRYEPDWVVYLTCFPNFILDAKVATAAKQVRLESKTACLSLSIFSIQNPAGQMKALPDLDYIPWGEPELPLMRLINGDNPESIEGLFYRDHSGVVRFTGEAPKLKNLDDFGVPVHAGLPIKLYRCPLSLHHPMTIVNCSRGCINCCVHCQAGSFQKPLRYRSVANVLEELKEIRSLGIKEIKFYDCSLPTNQEFTKELCKALRVQKFNFSWNCNARAEVLNEDILRHMKLAGCHTVSIGCESSNHEILKKMRKNETPEQIEAAVRLVKSQGMRVLIYLTFGLEGETKETMEQTYRFVKRLQPEFVTFGIVVPARGTPFYESLKNQGLLVSKEPEWQDPNALPSFSYPQLSPEEIHIFTRQAYRRYYFRPGYIIRRLYRMQSVTEFQMTIRNAFAMVRRYILEQAR